MFLLLQCPLLLVLGLAPVLGPVGLVEAALLYLKPPGVDGGLVLVSRLLVVAKAAVYRVVEGPAERLADSLDNRSAWRTPAILQDGQAHGPLDCCTYMDAHCCRLEALERGARLFRPFPEVVVWRGLIPPWV